MRYFIFFCEVDIKEYIWSLTVPFTTSTKRLVPENVVKKQVAEKAKEFYDWVQPKDVSVKNFKELSKSDYESYIKDVD